MKTNDYKSGKIAKLIGATHEALRFYHNNDIYTPVKKGQHKYDIYSDHDLSCLYNLRSYKTLGLPLKVSGNRIKKQHLDSISSNLNEVRDLVEQSTLWNHMILSHSDRLLEYTQEIEYSLGSFSKVTLPNIYSFSLINNSNLTDQELTTLKELATLTPIVLPMYTVPASYLKDTYSEAKCILGILEEDINYFIKYYGIQSLIDNGTITKLPTQKCLTTIVKIAIPSPYDQNAFTDIIQYLNDHNYTVTGDLIGTIIAVNYQRQNDLLCHDYYKVWIPIA